MNVAHALVFVWILGLGLSGFVGLSLQSNLSTASAAEIKLPSDMQTERFDFEHGNIQGWTTVDGRWSVEEVTAAPGGRRLLVLAGDKERLQRNCCAWRPRIRTSMCPFGSGRSQAGKMPRAVSFFAFPRDDTTSSGPTLSKTTSDSITTTALGTNSPQQMLNLRRSVSGTRYESSPSRRSDPRQAYLQRGAFA